jgi:hypothetical protein
MSEWWYEFFPQDISDEAAFHLVNIVTDFAAALDSHYYGQTHRHLKSIQPFCDPPILGKCGSDSGGMTEPF